MIEDAFQRKKNQNFVLFSHVNLQSLSSIDSLQTKIVTNSFELLQNLRISVEKNLIPCRILNAFLHLLSIYVILLSHDISNANIFVYFRGVFFVFHKTNNGKNHKLVKHQQKLI